MDRPHSFGKARRLRTKREFEAVYRRGLLLKGAQVRLFILEQPEPGEGRLGLSVSKAVGNAVARNRVKRWVREWFRTRPQPVRGLDLIVQARPGAADGPAANLWAELDRLLRQRRSEIGD